jgi:hypothetical protein
MRADLRWIRILFVSAGIYDGLLGMAFVVAPRTIFQSMNVAPPNHIAYVQFPAMLLIVFATMYFMVAARPVERRDLVPFGMGLKFAYCVLAFWYMATEGIPTMWVPWAWVDLVYLLLFALAWRQLAFAATLDEAS